MSKSLCRFIRRPTSYVQYRGTYALITGSSYGIGRCLAIGLGKRGLNIILLARSRDKLESLAQQLRKENRNIDVRMIVADITSPTVYAQIEHEVASLPTELGVVYLNHGGSFNEMRTFWDFNYEEIAYCETFNGTTVSRIIHQLFPRLLKQRRARVIMIGSTIRTVCEFAAPYAIEKEKTHGLTKALWLALKSIGNKSVEVQSMGLGTTATTGLAEVQGRSVEQLKPNLGMPSPETMAEAILNNYGLYSEPEIIPYWFHAFQEKICEMIRDDFAKSRALTNSKTSTSTLVADEEGERGALKGHDNHARYRKEE
ncbi:Very-long-chain 3-oxoacyl-CoA reductase 1 [Borealophlyctis nickersoniae]|nr:Very-long-chain 3-oxoacyl-CoA reductase 1 [Borealophlyctis nickersoniae]